MGVGTLLCTVPITALFLGLGGDGGIILNVASLQCLTHRYSELGNLTSAAVCVVYNSGLPAVTHVFDSDQMSAYWDKWLERLEQYHAENC